MGPTYVADDLATGVNANLGLATVAAFEADLDGGRVTWIGYPGFRLEDDRTLYVSALENLPPAAVPPRLPSASSRTSPLPERPGRPAAGEAGLARGYRTAITLSGVDFYQLWYRPNAPTLRWQFLKMLLGVAGVDAREHTEQPPFKDVQGLEAGPDHNIRYYVQAGLDTGLMRGLDGTRFAPFGVLTRAQAVTAAVRAAKLLESTGLLLAGRSPSRHGHAYLRGHARRLQSGAQREHAHRGAQRPAGRSGRLRARLGPLGANHAWRGGAVVGQSGGQF